MSKLIKLQNYYNPKNSYGRVSYYSSRKSKRPRTAYLDKILNCIAKGVWKKEITSYRATGNSLIKNNLPVFIPSGVCPPGPKIESSMSSHSGIICLDIDEGFDDVQEAKRLLADDDYTDRMFLSCSGNGLAVFFTGDYISLENHRHYHRAVCEYIKEKYGFSGSDAQGNPNRLRYVSYDPELYIAKTHSCELPSEWGIKIDDPSPQPTNYEGTTGSDDETLAWCKEMVSRTISYQLGYRNQWIFNVACMACEYGVDPFLAARDLFSLADLSDRKNPLTKTEIAKTVNSAYERATFACRKFVKNYHQQVSWPAINVDMW